MLYIYYIRIFIKKNAYFLNKNVYSKWLDFNHSEN